MQQSFNAEKYLRQYAIALIGVGIHQMTQSPFFVAWVCEFSLSVLETFSYIHILSPEFVRLYEIGTVR